MRNLNKRKLYYAYLNFFLSKNLEFIYLQVFYKF